MTGPGTAGPAASPGRQGRVGALPTAGRPRSPLSVVLVGPGDARSLLRHGGAERRGRLQRLHRVQLPLVAAGRGDGAGEGGEGWGGDGDTGWGAWYLLVVKTKTRVMMRMKRTRNAASPAMMPIICVSLLGSVTSPGPWSRAGVSRPGDPQAPPGAGALSPCPLPSPTHDDGQAQLHQGGQELRVTLYQPAKGSRAGGERPCRQQCPRTFPSPVRTGSAC